MSIKKKVILSLSVVLSMLVALVVGLVNMPKTSNSNTPATVMGGGYNK